MRRHRTISCLTILLSGTLGVSAEDGFLKSGTEFPVAGSLGGDQVRPAVAFEGGRGYVVWQDNATDGDGLGISARRLGASMSGEFGTIRINQNAVGDQENPKVALASGDGAMVVWQGGAFGQQQIFARVIGRSGTFASGDLAISPASHGNCRQPSIVRLNDGSFVIAWTAFGPDGEMDGVFLQRISSKGDKIGGVIQINDTTTYNQRDVGLASLDDGGFVAVWISESVSELRGETYSDLYSKRYDASGTAQGGETRLNTGKALCSPAQLAARPGGFVATWAQYDRENDSANWEIVARAFSGDGSAVGALNAVNTFTAGRQFAPSLGTVKNGYVVVWSSMDQDGSKEGVFGRALDANGKPTGDEFAVNTYTQGAQIHAVVTGDGKNSALAVWAGYSGYVAGVDLAAQRLTAVAPAIPAPAAPLVSGLSSSRLSVGWPALDGLSVASYEVTFDGAGTVSTTNNYCTSPAFLPGTSHTVTYKVKLSDGSQSPDSAVASGSTWGEDSNGDGLPDDWQAQYWGPDSALWPAAGADSDGDGVSNQREFLAGTNPADAASQLKARLLPTAQGVRLAWDTVPGLVYQVEASSDLKSWQRLGSARFAADTTDSIPVSEDARLSYFRITRIR